MAALHARDKPPAAALNRVAPLCQKARRRDVPGYVFIGKRSEGDLRGFQFQPRDFIGKANHGEAGVNTMRPS